MSNKTIAVFSIQSLGDKKPALAPKDLKGFADKHPELQKGGDAHTAFAMATVLQAPFVVVRSKGNRNQNNHILKPHIGDGGLLVITGHGAPGLPAVVGNYLKTKAYRKFHKQIERDPADIVNSAMEAGLKEGAHITILLSICYAAENVPGSGCLAQNLANAFAQSGINTTIIASNKGVRRFGLSAITNNRITFNHQKGIVPGSAYLFKTTVSKVSPAKTRKISLPGTLCLTEEGLSVEVANSLVPLAPKPKTEEPVPTVSSNAAILSAMEAGINALSRSWHLGPTSRSTKASTLERLKKEYQDATDADKQKQLIKEFYRTAARGRIGWFFGSCLCKNGQSTASAGAFLSSINRDPEARSILNSC